MTNETYCEALNVDGTPCRSHPIQGTSLCKVHGGKTTAKRTLTDRRRELRALEKELEQREKALVRRDKPAGKYREGAITALGDDGDADDPLQVARALTWRATVVADLIGKVDPEGQRHMQWLAEARKHNDSWARIKTDERYVRISAAQAFGVMRAVDEALREVVVDPDVIERIHHAVSESMDRAQRSVMEVDG